MFLTKLLTTCTAAVALAACHARKPPGAVRVEDYTRVRAAAEREVLRSDSLRVERLQLGALDTRIDTLRLEITNESGTARTLGVSIRTVPGLWVRGAWQRGFIIAVGAHERRVFALQYSIRRLTPEGRMLLAIGTPKGDSATGVSVVRPVIERQFAIGRGNPAALDPRRNFESLRTKHFDLYAYRGSPGARDIQRVADERERAVDRIGKILGTDFRGRVVIVLYPDSATKFNETGHIGMGWATNDMVVEIYNDRQRLDPFHELTHIVAGQVGSPPAMLDEGFATYVAELLGADALEHLGHAGRTVDQATCDLVRDNKRIPIDSLLRVAEFGSSMAPGEIMYPQGASAVKFLIEAFGVERFRKAFGELRLGTPTMNEAFTRIFGVTPADADELWLQRIQCGSR
jgi:hypothetical protein